MERDTDENLPICFPTMSTNDLGKIPSLRPKRPLSQSSPMYSRRVIRSPTFRASSPSAAGSKSNFAMHSPICQITYNHRVKYKN